jgi:hypothetical protein
LRANAAVVEGPPTRVTGQSPQAAAHICCDGAIEGIETPSVAPMAGDIAVTLLKFL